MSAYYNEIDPYAAQWLRNLIQAGHIADGVVDTRSIIEVQPDDLKGFTQCHFFAGIGVWSYALRLAGWSDTRPVWTGSCPCQPFSVAGKGTGFADDRHLWPELHRLISQCRPPVVFGEQVASKDGLAWLDAVQTDLEGTGYANAAVDLCAAGIGSPHIRQRLYWVGHAIKPGLEGYAGHGDGRPGRSEQIGSIATAGVLGGMAQDPISIGRRGWGDGDTPRHNWQVQVEGLGAHGDTGPTNGFWRDADWLGCRDGKWRPVEPGSFPLAHGVAARVGRLRAYGNAIVPQVAQTFIETYMEWNNV